MESNIAWTIWIFPLIIPSDVYTNFEGVLQLEMFKCQFWHRHFVNYMANAMGWQHKSETISH